MCWQDDLSLSLECAGGLEDIKLAIEQLTMRSQVLAIEQLTMRSQVLPIEQLTMRSQALAIEQLPSVTVIDHRTADHAVAGILTIEQSEFPGGGILRDQAGRAPKQATHSCMKLFMKGEGMISIYYLTINGYNLN